VAWGAGPRASQYLVVGAKARAVLAGRFAATVEDVRALARPVLRHRVLPNFTAESEGLTSVALIDELLQRVQA
jgi:MoxR-like ATPase